MGARTIPDGAAVTNHYVVSFAPWIEEAGATNVAGLKDTSEVIDGPDGRGYSTGKKSRQDLTVTMPMHDPFIGALHRWKRATENGAFGHNVVGVVTVADAADRPIAIYELLDCKCYDLDPSDLQMDGAEVGMEVFTISYSTMRRIGP